jgi:hypothetical protein
MFFPWFVSCYGSIAGYILITDQPSPLQGWANWLNTFSQLKNFESSLMLTKIGKFAFSTKNPLSLFVTSSQPLKKPYFSAVLHDFLGLLPECWNNQPIILEVN